MSPPLLLLVLKLIKSAPATLRAEIACPAGTPYEGRTMTLELIASDGYPFMPPAAKILERVSWATTGTTSLFVVWESSWC